MWGNYPRKKNKRRAIVSWGIMVNAPKRWAAMWEGV